MDEREYLEGLLEACEAEMRGRGEAVSDFLREQPGDALSNIKLARDWPGATEHPDEEDNE